MADYVSKNQAKIDLKINTEFTVDAGNAKKLAAESAKDAKSAATAVETIEKSMKKVQEAMKKAMALRGKNNKNQKEQEKFNERKAKQIDKLSKKYKDLSNSLATASKNQAKFNKESNKKAATGGESFGGRLKSGLAGGRSSIAGGIGAATGTLARYAIGGALVGGAVAGLGLIVKGIKESIALGIQFETQLADLAAVAGISTKEVEALGQAAFQLAGSTKFSVEEIIGLQRELAKLGFSKDEILSTQSAIAGLAQATGESLGTAAQLTGKVLRAFSLEASSATRVANTLVTSVNDTALNLETLATALQYVSPIASTFGISLEETNAAIGVLANNGFTASRAGTGLRQVLLELGESGSSITEVLRGVAENGLGVTDAVELVGKRGAPALLALIDNLDEVDRLAEESAKAFTALVAEAKQLSTTQSAFQNAGVAVKTLATQIGGAISEALDLRGLGLTLLDTFTFLSNGAGDLTAEMQALQPVIASLGDATLDWFQEEATSQEQIKGFLEAKLELLRATGKLSQQEATFAKKAVDATAKRLFNEKQINNAVRERQDLLAEGNDKIIKSISGKIDSGDFSGAEKDIDTYDDAAKRNIKALERELKGISKSLEAASDEDEKQRLALREAQITAEIESEKQFRQQLLNITLDYEKQASVLNNNELQAQIKIAKAKKKTYEDIFKNSKLSAEEIRKLSKLLADETDLIDAYNKELQKRGVEEAKANKKPQEERLKTFEQIAKIEDDLREQVQLALDGKQIDVRASEQLQKEYEEEIKLLGLNTEAYRRFYEERANARAEAEAKKKKKKGISGFDTIDDSDLNTQSSNNFGSITKRSGLKDIREAIAEQERLLGEVGDRNVFDQILNRISKLEEKEADLIAQRKDLINQIGGEVIGFGLDQIQAKLDAEKQAIDARFSYEEDRLRSSLESGIISQEQYEAQRLELEKKRIAETNRIEKKEFNINKVNSLSEIAISTAKAVMDKPALAPFIIGLGAAQAARVSLQKFQPVQYEEGGWVNGPSHSAGGVPFTVQGQGGYEMEGGEFIVNKTAMANPMIASQVQALNSMGNRSVVTGNPRMFADGGMVSSANTDSVVAMLQKPLQVFVSEREQMERSNTKVRTDSRSTL